MKKIGALILICIALPALSQESLEEFQRIAIEKNPGLKAHYHSFEASLERAAQASGLPNPTLSMGYFIQPVETRVGPQIARLSLAQMFPWFGKLSAAERAESHYAEAQYQKFIDAREKLRYQVAASYCEIWQYQVTMQLERENLQLLEDFETLVTTELSSGDGSLSEVYRVQMAREENQTRLIILEKRLKLEKQNFNRLLNRSPATAISVNDSLSTSVKLVSPMDSLAQHPRMLQFEKMLESNREQQIVARKDGYPSFGLGLDYIITGQNKNLTSSQSGQDAILPMISVSLPIWRKPYRAAVKEAELQALQYQRQYDEELLRVQNEWDNTQFNWQEGKAEHLLYQREIQLVKNTLDLALTAYANDDEDFEEILRLQRNLLQFKKQSIKAQQKMRVARAYMRYLNFQTIQNSEK